MQNVSRFDIGDKFEYAEMPSVSGWDVFSQLSFCAAFEHTDTWSHSAVVENECQSDTVSSPPSGL